MDYSSESELCVRAWLKEMTEIAANSDTKHIQLYYRHSDVSLYIGSPKPETDPHHTIPPKAADTIFDGVLGLTHDPDKAIKEIESRGICSTDIQRKVLGNCGYHLMINKIGAMQKILTITATLTDSEVAEMKEACAKKHQTVEQINQAGRNFASTLSVDELEQQVNRSIKG